MLMIRFIVKSRLTQGFRCEWNQPRIFTSRATKKTLVNKTTITRRVYHSGFLLELLPTVGESSALGACLWSGHSSVDLTKSSVRGTTCCDSAGTMISVALLIIFELFPLVL